VYNIDLESTCKNLGFEITPYKFRGRDDTNLLEISRDGKFICMVTERYKLIPNEIVLEIAENIATMTGAEKTDIYEEDGNIIIQYLLDAFELPGGTMARAGFYVTNSVGGGMSFRIKSFLMYEDKIIYLGTLVSGIVRKHTKNIDIDMKKIMDTATDAIARAVKFAWNMDEWKNISVKYGKGIGLLEKVRVSKLPNVYRPSYLLKPTKRVKESDIPDTPDELTLFGMYMDLIHTINHPPTGRLSEKTKIDYFNMIHKSLEEAMDE